MKHLLLSFAVAATGVVIYHIGQKTISSTANPMVLLMAAYAVAFVLAAIAAPFFRNTSSASWITQVTSWPVLLLGVGVLLIEIGFLLAYRSGGSVQWAGVAVNGIAAILLVPVALFLFRESFSLARAAGIVLTLSGLALMTRR